MTMWIASLRSQRQSWALPNFVFARRVEFFVFTKTKNSTRRSNPRLHFESLPLFLKKPSDVRRPTKYLGLQNKNRWEIFKISHLF
ncbi:hypothetical protein A3I18_00405 [Candidatus Campbellbacteria bacterium RIFCSPLOWO2_02_FULL_35_11]|uniref:Uncharacterized protein n=1 Tax=Candidatus Campbellbacteria bacterium RIFCSPLOWO2_02_FULL_35_11 TaxID=1797581 RepID=A0A1F5ERG4_9BACT|nr:MAG: hypothetical protein A3I18_00405 [Candidatus Campbellbacteria bacterium RIFCSPLOWO2_02_FULL_35_11]